MGSYDRYKEEVLETCLWLSDHGYFGSLRGTGGNVSVRIENRDLMAVTPSSVKYHEIVTDDICITDLSVAMVEGSRAPSIEAGMHAAIYRNRPDVNAIVHTHQIFASVFAVLAEPVPALFDEVAFAIGDIIDIVPYALSGSADLVANVTGKLGNGCLCYIMQNHGALALGKTMEKALLHAELMEKTCRIYCHALGTGKTVNPLPAEVVGLIRNIRKTPA